MDARQLTRGSKPRSLLDLHPELLISVFQYLEHDKAGKRAICRALLFLTRPNLLRRVRIHSPGRLHDFVRTFPPPSKHTGKPETRSSKPSKPTQKRRNSLGQLVKELDLPDVDFDEGEELDDCRALRKVLTMARGTEILRLEGTGALRVMLTSFRSYRSLQHLHTLELADFDAIHVRLYDIAHFGRLRLFPKLTRLVLDVHYDADETDPALVKRVQPVPNITHLVLSAGMSLSDASASNFISHFTRLTHLELTLTDLCELSLLLQAVSPTLVSFSIEFGDYIDWLDDNARIVIDSHLARLTNLEELSLGERTFSSHIFTALSSLRALRTITLSVPDDLDLDAADLLRYLRESQRKLRRFTLNGFYSQIHLIPSEHPDDPVIAKGIYNFEDLWHLPQWTPSFTLEHAKEVVRVADSMGVELDGWLGEAVVVEELRRREERYLEDRRDEVVYDIAWLFEQSEEEFDEVHKWDEGLLALAAAVEDEV
ncbi:hypothetical protein JCM10207_004453 [Rhodosporidiobolus poonsookiae]